MIAYLLDDPETLFTVLSLAAFAAILLLRWRFSGRVVEGRQVRSLGSFGRLDAHLVSSPGGARYLSLDYEVESDEETKELHVLFSPRQAKALAAHLRVAAQPHASLALARVSARREAQAEKARA
jgi:hypothetical protein